MKEGHREGLWHWATQPVVWLLMCFCPSKAEGKHCCCPCFLVAEPPSPFCRVRKNSTRLWICTKLCCSAFPPHTGPWNGGYSRCGHIPGPRASLRPCLYPCTSTTLSTALHLSLPPPSVSTAAPEGPQWVPHCAHTAEVLKKARSGCAFICLLHTQQGHHLGPPLPQGVRAAFPFIFSLGGGEE